MLLKEPSQAEPSQAEPFQLAKPNVEPSRSFLFSLPSKSLPSKAVQKSEQKASPHLSLSTHQLDNAIDRAIHAYFPLADRLPLANRLKRHITDESAPPFEQAGRPAAVAGTPQPSTLKKKIAQEYGNTCTLLWHTSFQSQPSAPLTDQSQRLLLAWAQGKYHLPSESLFESQLTGTAALQVRWRSPHIQSALCAATAQLLISPTQVSIAAHPSSWVYLCGGLMHQLLQWNHQLTPQTLRELFT